MVVLLVSSRPHGSLGGPVATDRCLRLVDPERGRPGQRAGFDDGSSSREYGRGVLVGRDPERAQLGSLVELARHGSAGSVVVRGEPGIGKSALLDAVVADVGDATVLTTQGLEAEAPLAFAALHRLLRPVLRLRDGLPAPQARALGVAFGEEDGPGVEPFLVAVATLSMLTAAAEEKLVVCLVDDAHWLDSASADALLFCARRLGADRVVMVFAAREGTEETFDPQGLPELVLSGSRSGVGSGSALGAPGWRARGGGGREAGRGDPGQPARTDGAAR